MSFMLVIEDDEMLREELVELLNTWGVETLGARCGRDGGCDGHGGGYDGRGGGYDGRGLSGHGAWERGGC